MASHKNFFEAITFTKENIFTPGEIDKDYSPYIINRMLSRYSDLILYVNEMNISENTSPALQFHFYMNVIPKKKRRVLYDVAVKNPDIDVIMDYYNVSKGKAEFYIRLLTPDQINNIKERINKGGR